MTDEGTDFAYDFFVSRRGSVGEVATEVASVLEGADYRVRVQDYDFGRGGDFVGDIHDALVSCHHLVVLHTADYDRTYWTRKEFTNFLAALPSAEGARRICVLRCDDSAPRGLLKNVVHGDLVGVTDPEERAGIILATARGEPLRARHQPPVFGGPMPARNRNFTGRAALLDAVHASLAATPDEPTALTQAAVHGLGGVGKTSLAREYVHRFGPDHAGVWWLTAETRGGLVAGLAALAARLDPKLVDEPELEKAARAALARVERSGQPFLLVYDNVPSPGALEGLVPARGARVLLTTRWADWGGRAREVLVEALAEDEAVEFLQTRADRREPAGARRLARDLGCLPLALDHAGAYVRLAVMGFGAYAERVEELIAKAPKDALYPASVTATFDLAIASAVQECAAAEALLGFFAFLAPERIPLDLVDRTVLPEDERGEALMALTAVSLVRPDPATADDEVPSVSVHRLVQAVARTRLAARDAANAMLETVVSRLAEAFPVGAYSGVRSWPQCERLLPHVLVLRERARRRDHASSSFSDLLDRTASFLHGRGSLREAEPLYREALLLRHEGLGSRHPDTLTSLNNLAGLYQAQGRYGEAEPRYREALLLRREVLGPRHPDTLTSLNNLAGLHQAQGRYGEAEPRHREALLLRREGLGPRHPDTLTSLNNLAGLYQAQGRYGEAEPRYREAVQLRREVLGPRHPDTLTSLNNLAGLYQAQGRYGEAEPLFREAVQLRREVLGPRHPDTLTSLNNLAMLYGRQGHHNEAKPLHREASEGAQTTLGPVHPTTLLFQLNGAVNLAALGHVADALRQLQDMEPHLLGRLAAELYTSEAPGVRNQLVASQADYQHIVLSLALLPGAGPAAAGLAATAVLRLKGLQAEEEAFLARLARSGRDPRARELAAEVAALRSQLAAVALREQLATMSVTAPGEGRAAAATAAAALAERLQAREFALARLSREYDRQLQVRGHDAAGLRAALAPRTALLELREYRPVDFRTGLLGLPRWAGVLVTRGEVRVLDLGPVAPAAAAARALLLADTEGKAGRRAARALHDQLLGPLAAELEGLERLYVAPDGDLYLVPLAALLGPDGRRLAERLDLRLLQTGRDLLRSYPDRLAKGLLALGGIDFDAATPPQPIAAPTAESMPGDVSTAELQSRASAFLGRGFSPLPATTEEVRAVAGLYRAARPDEPVEVWEGVDASEARLRARHQPPRVLHLATHNFNRTASAPLDRPMLLSGIALAGANGALHEGDRDGILHAIEAQDLNLEGTELVVLSASETALGQIDYGEGVSGLVRALRTAGARYVLVTLRPVSDEGAADFMRRFYRHWLRQRDRSDPAAAFRAAQLEAMAAPPASPARHDQTWAHFVLVG